MERESMQFDVLVVGAGPAGLAAAIKLKQLNAELNVCVVEKGSEVGAHILSGAVFEPQVLDELLPNWQADGAPLHTAVNEDEIYYLSADKSQKLPNALTPKTMHNQGNYIISLANLCRWLAEQAEQLGVEIYPGFAAAELLEQDGVIIGVVTGDMGLSQTGEQKASYMAGMELRAPYTLFAEGSRGHLGKQLIEKYELDKACSPQHYGLGFKEIWQLPKGQTQAGKVVHTAGWPLSEHGASGGGYLYHADNDQIWLGLIVDLNYANPHLNPFAEFQRLKTHPLIAEQLAQGERIAYGARAISKGGFNSLPKMSFPGGLLIGCEAGTLNFAKIKGCHTAMRSGMLAAEQVASALAARDADADAEQALGRDLTDFAEQFAQSNLHQELYQARNFGPALHKFGTLAGGAFNTLDQNLFSGRLPLTLRDQQSDASQLHNASSAAEIHYPKADGKLSFDRLSSVYLASVQHEEDQPCHLQLADADIPIQVNLAQFAEPAQRYCPAGVYEVVQQQGESQFQINAANCIHCKTCDIKDPSQNITWLTPEGGSGPNYGNM